MFAAYFVTCVPQNVVQDTLSWSRCETVHPPSVWYRPPHRIRNKPAPPPYPSQQYPIGARSVHKLRVQPSQTALCSSTRVHRTYRTHTHTHTRFVFLSVLTTTLQEICCRPAPPAHARKARCMFKLPLPHTHQVRGEFIIYLCDVFRPTVIPVWKKNGAGAAVVAFPRRVYLVYIITCFCLSVLLSLLFSLVHSRRSYTTVFISVYWIRTTVQHQW